MIIDAVFSLELTSQIKEVKEKVNLINETKKQELNTFKSNISGKTRTNMAI